MTMGPNFTAQTFCRPPPDPARTDVPFAFIHVNKCGGSSIEIALGLPKTHDTAAQRREAVGRRAWEAAYTFATVRNPFDRVVSIYYYRVRTDQAGMADRHLTINAWVRETFARRNPRYWQDGQLLWPAADWLCEDGEMLVEHVVRLEDIAREWPGICHRLGVSRPLDIYNNNLHPPHGAILNAAARRTIEEAFAEDLDRFGYRFIPA